MRPSLVLDPGAHLELRLEPGGSGPIVLPRRPTLYERTYKPWLDRIGGLLLLVALSPLLLAVTLCVSLSLGRPILYRQKRVGLKGRTFDMLKFRTMRPDRRREQCPFDGPDRRRTHKTPNDPRHTSIGRLLRAYSLDELPQLWNVVLGDLSLVGPRPELTAVVARYEPWQHLRHAVKPGLTGLWQITERGNGLMHEHTDVDLLYLKSVSFLTDIKILMLTVPAVLGLRRGM